MAEAKKTKRKNVEFTSKIAHMEDPKFNEIMDAVRKIRKANQTILSIERPRGLSGASSQAPPITPTPPILIPTIEIQYVKEGYGEEIINELNLQPHIEPLIESHINT